MAVNRVNRMSNKKYQFVIFVVDGRGGATEVEMETRTKLRRQKGRKRVSFFFFKKCHAP